MKAPKLFMLLLGGTPPGRHIEQHEIFFGIAESLKDLVPFIKSYWTEPVRVHIDAWREINNVDGYAVRVQLKNKLINMTKTIGPQLYFINLGGYLENQFAEQHYLMVTAGENQKAAIANAKHTHFFSRSRIPGGNSHIDDKYGIDIDDLYKITDILLPEQKQLYQIELLPAKDLAADSMHLGYLKLDRLARNIFTTE